MQDCQQQAGFRSVDGLFARVPALLREYHPLVSLIVVGLLAIGVSGAVCGLIGWGFGRDAIAGDTLSAYLSPARCAQLLRNEPQTTDCHSAELLDHSDEVVLFRLAAAPVAAIIALGYVFARRKWVRDARESEPIRRLGALLGLGAFGLAAVILLSIAGFRAVVDGDTAGLGRWLADGSVAAVFCLIYGFLVLRSPRSRRHSAA